MDNRGIIFLFLLPNLDHFDLDRSIFGHVLFDPFQSSRKSVSPIEHSPDPNDDLEWFVQQGKLDAKLDSMVTIHLAL